MSNEQSKFVWYELMTTDLQAAEKFYGEVIGWAAADAGMPGWAYTLLSTPAQVQVGGMMTLPPEARDAGARPGWMGYVSVPDVDAMAAQVKAASGTIHREPADIPGVGRFAVAADPQGAVFTLFKGSSSQAPTQPAPGAPGHAGWHELHARDRESAFAFYAQQFGWTKGEAVDMGPMGIYQLFATGGDPVGGMMNKAEEVPAPFWLFYFNVDEIEAAVGRVKAAGGQVINGPHPVPGGSWIAQCIDPQGAMFALVETRPM